MRLRVVSFNSQWQGFSSTRLKALAWSIRAPKQVRAVAKLKPDLVLVQEMGKDEASLFFRLLEKELGKGANIAYQRFGPLNCVAWNVNTLPVFDSTLNVDTRDYGQYPGRGGPIVKLKAKDETRVRGFSFHNPVKTGNDAAAQVETIKYVCSKANDDVDDWPLIVGIDTNNRQSDDAGMWVVLKKYGYTWKRKGIDAILLNFKAKFVSELKTVDLGNASDHNLLYVDVEVPSPMAASSARKK